jgi:hypothetical protein
MALQYKPRSPDLSVPNSFSFPPLKAVLKGKFKNTEEVTARIMRAFREVPQKCFHGCYRELSNIGISVSLNMGTTLKGMLCK